MMIEGLYVISFRETGSERIETVIVPDFVLNSKPIEELDYREIKAVVCGEILPKYRKSVDDYEIISIFKCIEKCDTFEEIK